MKTLKILTGYLKRIVEAIQDILVPEDAKIKKLLDLPSGEMQSLLPKSPVCSEDLFVLFDYQNKTVRLLVKSIKYKNNARLRKRIAQYLHEELMDISEKILLFEGSLPLLIPMPMSKKEKRQRGFNQCEEIIKEIKKLAGNNMEISYNTLKKVRETERQTKLSREKREQNVKNSMSVQMSDVWKIRNRVCIILDDVYTTGASIIEARRALLSAGARRALGLFIAH